MQESFKGVLWNGCGVRISKRYFERLWSLSTKHMFKWNLFLIVSCVWRPDLLPSGSDVLLGSGGLHYAISERGQSATPSAPRRRTPRPCGHPGVSFIYKRCSSSSDMDNCCTVMETTKLVHHFPITSDKNAHQCKRLCEKELNKFIAVRQDLWQFCSSWDEIPSLKIIKQYDELYDGKTQWLDLWGRSLLLFCCDSIWRKLRPSQFDRSGGFTPTSGVSYNKSSCAGVGSLQLHTDLAVILL